VPETLGKFFRISDVMIRCASKTAAFGFGTVAAQLGTSDQKGSG
jgi:hypothetical protein